MVANDRRDDDNNIARRPTEAVWFASAPNIMVDARCSTLVFFLRLWLGSQKFQLFKESQLQSNLKVTQIAI